jgi:hypothetical protein
MLQTLDLTDARVAHHYMIAMRVLHDLPSFAWYDSHFLARFEAARRMLEATSPDRLDDFVAAFAPLRTDPGFRVTPLRPVLDTARFEDLLAQVRSLPQARLKGYEAACFGRRIVHDLPILTTLQRELTALVSDLAGEAVEPCYNFLSLYHGDGRCPPHLDAPSAKWTLDLCLAQSCEWPIRLGPVVPWPTAAGAAQMPRAITPDALGMDFRDHVLRPNEAILFSGSSQWHYRDAIPDAGFCHLAFLHYHPAGCAAIVEPASWAAHFALPELAVLNAVFDAVRPDARA